MKRIILSILCVYFLLESLGAENVNVIKPKAGLSINETTGTFVIYTIDAKGKKVPVFEETSDITAFYLRANNKVYRLRSESGITTQARKTQNGGAITYTLANLAEVTVEFSFVETLAGRPADMIRVDARVRNTTSRQQTFSIKALFDTTLGESDASFFSTAGQDKITSEYMIATMASHQWIKVADNGNTMRFLLYGAGITTPRSVVLANKDMMKTSVWDTAYSQGRSFTSNSAKNNAAVDIIWDPIQVQSGQTNTISFYIALGSGQPPSPTTLTKLAELNPSSTTTEPVASAPQPRAPVASAPQPRATVTSAPSYAADSSSGGGIFVQPPTPTHDTIYGSAYTAPVPGLPQPPYPPSAYPQSVYPQSVYPPSAVYDAPSAYQYPPQAVTNNSKPIDMDYALDLYDRIQRLSSESGGIDSINREEIIRLNAELDRFLNQIGRK